MCMQMCVCACEYMYVCMCVRIPSGGVFLFFVKSTTRVVAVPFSILSLVVGQLAKHIFIDLSQRSFLGFGPKSATCVFVRPFFVPL